MKSYNHLYEQYISEKNYYLGVKNATRHKGGKKKKYKKAQYYKNNAEQLKDEMLEYARNFKNHEHTPKEIYDGIQRKKRTILIPTMDEQIIHHMIVNILKPIFMKTMYEHSYGSIPERGAMSGKKKKSRGGKETIEKWIQNDKENTKYILKMDIKKYFESIPHNILKDKFTKLIHDKQFLAILYTIIDVINTNYGIPIGFYTSQWIANWYLTELDHYIKEKLKVKYYIRYMDDMVIFGNNKEKLHSIKIQIEKYLREQLGLILKENWQIYLFDNTINNKQIGRSLNFMGFQFFKEKTTLRKNIMLKSTRKARKIFKKTTITIYDCRQMLAYYGWIKHTNTFNMYKQHIKPIITFIELKKYMSNYDKGG